MNTLLAESYLHRLDPFAIQLTESFGLRWYGLSYAAGFLIGWLIIRWFARTNRSPLSVQGAGDLMFFIIAGVLIGGRLGFVFFYAQGRPFIEFNSSFPYWEVLAINRGGMSSHGGMLGVIAACWLYGHRNRISVLHLFDLFALASTPGLFLGRIANFVNAELWGRPLVASLQVDPPAWSVKYPQEILETGFSNLTEVHQRLRSVVGGEETFLQNIVDAVGQGNQQVIELLRPLLTAYWPSQIFQAVTDGPVLLCILGLIWLKPRKPGVISGWFLILYGLLRIATEFVRQPDVGVSLFWGASRGQVLSVLMVMAGLAFIAVWSRRAGEAQGGLQKPRKT